MNIEHIENLTKNFAGARAELADRLQALKDEQEAIRRRRMTGIRNALARLQGAHGELHAAVEASPDLFDKPRTRVLHGVKVGWQKARGKLVIADAENTVALIEKLLPDQVGVLVKIAKSPIRSALQQLPARDLKRLGVAVTDDIDAVLIKPADGDLDRLIAALLDDPELEEAVAP